MTANQIPGVEELVKLLERIRDLLSSLPVDCLGSGTGANGQPYPIRDEVIHGITKALAQQQATGITAAELGYALKRATPAQVIEYLEDDVNMRVALSIHFEEQHDQQPAAVDGMAELVELLDEVRSHFTRDDDLPDDLLPRIDAALAAQNQEPNDVDRR